MTARILFAAACVAAPCAALVHAPPALAQEAAVAELRADPPSLEIEAGVPVAVQVTAHDASGQVVDVRVRVAAPRQGLRYNRTDGTVTGLAAGDWQMLATYSAEGTRPVVLRIPVAVTWPAIARVDVRAPGTALYAGTSLRLQAAAFHANGSERPGAALAWTSSNPEVASVDRFGNVTAHAPGTAVVTASVEGVPGEFTANALPLELSSMSISADRRNARTGDVVAFALDARDEADQAVTDAAVDWSYSFLPDDSIASPGAAALARDGKFVANVPGQYTVLATLGERTARAVIDVRPREAVQEVEVVGQGLVSHVHSSDLWVFEGMDGRDYAFTGTWGGDGWAYFWDVTDPASPVRTDSLRLDARTVNDVKVAPNARYAALSREGASNRRNGVVILDLADPAHPVVASTYDEGLTGGVHNMFATDDHLFALSGGDKYVVLDMTDLANPRYVSEYNHPGSRIHDVWVHDGIAYSSEWQNGVVVVDVGNGRWGGSIERPVFVTNVPYPVGRTHAAFPYYQESTGKFYLFLGDEIMNRQGAAWSGAGLDRIPAPGGTPSVTSGYLHVIDFTDPENPKDVARYEVPEFGTHNIWVEDDVLYQAYYEGGLRVVDVSGELMGNLAEQGREMAVYKSFAPQGYAANAPMVWGGQPHKGNVFFSDFNSGLWAVKLTPKRRPVS